jgi:hypothetical protein
MDKHDKDVSISDILVNAIIFSAISLLRENALSPGILDKFFLWNIVSCAQIFNW